MELTKRKGSRTIASIPKDILFQLNAGQLETANLVEWLAIDQRLLLRSFLVAHKREAYYQPIILQLDGLKKVTVNTTNQLIGKQLLSLSNKQNDSQLLQIMAQHPADVVRCWATYTIAHSDALNFSEKLLGMQSFADDHHFGVREIAWLALRPEIAQNAEEAIKNLKSWVFSENANIRRFCTEATRPRGVWCEHIELLKNKPALGLDILEPLKADPSKYVQDSVGNWLNDASKTQAEWVSALCDRWKTENRGKDTAYIIKRALRSLKN